MKVGDMTILSGDDIRKLGKKRKAEAQKVVDEYQFDHDHSREGCKGCETYFEAVDRLAEGYKLTDIEEMELGY